MKDLVQHGMAFPAKYLDAEFNALLGVTRLLESGRWKTAKVQPYPTSETLLQKEIEDLLEKQHSTERMDIRQPEILEEADKPSPKFGRVMLFDEVSHPMTARLITDMVIGGRPVIIHFKTKFARPRPSQICPEIEPLIDVPGHPAYPSGHSFQTHLIAMALSELLPHLSDRFTAIAERVAENREWAGVHYSSDSMAGKALARDLFPEFRAAFAEDFEAATQEWAG